MGFVDFIKGLKKREWVNIGFFIISLAMLIAGSVMLAVAIASIPPMPPFPDEMPTTTVAPVLQPTVIFSTAFANGIPWNGDYANPSSDSFKAMASQIGQNISDAYSRPQSNFGSAPLTIQVNALTQAQNGINFYSELIFPDTTATTMSVTSALSSIGYLTNSFVSSTSQCSGLIPPVQQSSVNPSNQPNLSTTPMKLNAICDASSTTLTNIFLVDVSDPIIGTLNDKLSKISTYLNAAPSLVNLDQTASWSNQEFRLVAYGANEPTPMGRARNQQSWNSIVANLNSTIVNPTKEDGHQLTDALRYVYNNYRPSPGVAGNIIVLADGFDFDETQTLSPIATALKTQYHFSIGVILMSTSQAQQAIVQQLATDFNHFYPVDSVDYLMNQAVLQTQAQWICGAYFPTNAPLTPPPTHLPLITTTGTTINPAVRTTSNPLLPEIASCTQNVLFLIDQSQNMILNGYTSAVQFAINSATSLASYNSNSTFAYILYNQVVVSESTGYSSLSNFIASIKNAPQNLGDSDITVGFNEAANFINTKSQFNQDSITSILYFITDGNDFNNNIPKVKNTTMNIRSQLQTEIFGVDLVETSQSKANVQTAIQYKNSDGFIPSVYYGVAQPANILTASSLNSTLYSLKCKDYSHCYTGLTFVIETSEAEGNDYVNVQTQAVLNILSNYKNMISPFQLSVSLIYFSSPDDLVPNQTGMSGTLFDHFTDGQQAIDTLNTTTFSLGPASDLQLGFSLTAKNLQNGYLQNNNLVVFFARGAYEQLSNCCPDPTADAAAVRQLSTVQGVVIGPYSSKSGLDGLTASNSIDANALIGNSLLNTTENRAIVAKKISDAIIPTIDSFIQKQYCPGIPSFINPPCEDPIDTLILLNANDRTNWNNILNFTAAQLIPDLLGSTGSDPSKVLTSSTPINFAIASYYYLDVLTHADFTYLLSLSGYQNLINSISFRETKGTATLSTAYKKAIEYFQDGRPYASKNLILITDTLDISDMENAFSEHDAMVQLVGGYTSALTINTNTAPGADYQLNINSYQLNRNNAYSVRQISNSLTQHTCTYQPFQPQPPQTPSPSPTLPGPIPVVKARSVWPDITILLDTSISSDNSMTDIYFEKVRTFLEILLIQYSVGEKGSRFTIATYDGDNIQYSCRFIETNNYYDLSSCINEKLSFFSRSHSTYRNINSALSNIRQNIYENSTSGYRMLNENFLVLFTLGTSSSSANQELTKIQRKGVHTISIGLSSNLSNTDLSSFAQTSFMISDWNSSFTGIDTNYNLADRIWQMTTKKRSPSTSNFVANFVYIVDQSGNTYSDHSNIVQYVTDSVSPFLVNNVKTQMSIIPFADTVIAPLSLSSSQLEVDQYLATWKSSAVSTSYTANVGDAVQYASNMIGTTTTPTYVIFVVGGTNLTGSSTAKQLLKTDLYVANYNISNANNYNDLVYSNSSIFSVTSSSQLLNRVVPLTGSTANPILALSSDINNNQQASDSLVFPVSSIAADIILLLDETGLTDQDFSHVKSFLQDFTAKFTVGPFSTQFGLQAFNGRTIPDDGFHLFDSTSNDVVKKRLQELTLAKATENSTDADLSGAIMQELFFFLTESNGWRDDVTTYTIIFSHADSFYQDDSHTSTAMGVKNVSSVFAVGLNGQTFPFVRNFTNTGFYETVNNVSSLNINSPAIVDLLTSLQNDYKEIIYPTPINIKDVVKADFIFLVDNALGSSYTQRVQQFFNSFINNVGGFSDSGNDTRMAVVSYGNAVSTAWSFEDRQDVSSLKTQISQFQITSTTGSSNLRRAIDHVILNEMSFGVNSTRPTYLIVIAGSSVISPNIDGSTSRHLNTRYSTFMIQTNSGNNTYSYASQLLGTQLTSDRVDHLPVLDFNNNINLTPWIENEFTAWKTTFPDKSS